MGSSGNLKSFQQVEAITIHISTSSITYRSEDRKMPIRRSALNGSHANADPVLSKGQGLGFLLESKRIHTDFNKLLAVQIPISVENTKQRAALS